ncbi:MAG: tRNA preQ1(34) S-adenosylmethionine ribosyltransferase-isomerase QueA [Caldimicrobium sp.]|nr:tRNA preQ1(34) S-adenosylmethionine ribosyltransferase-isomerase QueA [Caldimicrobium sp.]MCX7612710.1 tRNA preQ1(34) S-adenosylmethionine ribosyltransferase-isomerase QueA [Caldimicrobium sp.]MDW8182430.1 tRNA preQ1(34) S-adenosylmethionine ribosyltransferase-isomerase QueA [Caldimicrobium sp.]
MNSIPPDFDIQNYDYPLPEKNIAYFPPKERSLSKLLVIDRKSGNLSFHSTFSDIEFYLQSGDLLILNDTKVFPARLKAIKSSGGEAEILLFEKPKGLIFETVALLKGKRIKPGHKLYTSGDERVEITVLEKLEGGKFRIQLKSLGNPLEDLIYSVGKVPLPPYIKREPEVGDIDRYQTVYAQKEGSIAAPTAGFHFDEVLLAKLKYKGVKLSFLTLHVGYGTFAPIRSRDIRLHRVDPEYIEVPGETVEEVKKALMEKRRVIAVGTTVVRSLEFLALRSFEPYSGLCDLYIYPGFTFKVISGMITNFHLPKSSLLLLVCAFAGRELILKAYAEALKRGYRFYSYGDATFII